MEKDKKKKSIELISDDSKVKKIIETLKENTSLYKKIISTLLSLGDFNNSIKCNVYEIFDNDDLCYIKLWSEDLDGNIYVFCPISTIKQDLNIIQKISNDSEKNMILLCQKNLK